MMKMDNIFIIIICYAETFADEFVRQNHGGEIPNRDCAFVLSFSLMMLNTDAHNPSILEKDKMTLDQFVRNNRGQWIEGKDPPLDLLQRLYAEILREELKVRAQGIPEKQGTIRLRCIILMLMASLTMFRQAG